MSVNAAILPIHIDSTMMNCSRQCQRKFLNEFVYGCRPPGLSIDLHAGACFSTALEAAYKALWLENLELDAALVKSHAAFALAWSNFEIPDYKNTAKTYDRMWEAVEDYFSVYSPRTDPVKPYFSADGKPTFEYTFAIPLEPAIDSTPGAGSLFHTDCFPLHPSGSPFLYCGRFDMLGSYLGMPVVRDEKTTGRSIGQNWAEQWDLRSQFIGYVWACQQCGIPVETVIVRGISILKKSFNHAEAIKTYSKTLVSRWYEQLRRDLWRIRLAHDEGYWDFNLGESCTACGHCPFMSSCTSADPELWLNQFEVRRWNPLDRNPVDEQKEAA